MEHAFSRVVAILMAAVTFAILPLVIHMERQESMIQLSVMSDTVQFVDSVRNMGVLTKEMYERYQSLISSRKAGLSIKLVHYRDCLQLQQGKIEHTEKYTVTEEILSCLEREESYQFEQGEFFRVEVIQKGKGWMEKVRGLWMSNEELYPECYVYYGGSIRFEN